MTASDASSYFWPSPGTNVPVEPGLRIVQARQRRRVHRMTALLQRRHDGVPAPAARAGPVDEDERRSRAYFSHAPIS